MVPYDQVKLADRVWERKWQRGSCATTVTWHFFIIIKIWIWIDVRGLVKTRWRLLICFSLVKTQPDSQIFFLWKCIVLLEFWDKNWHIISKLNSNTIIKKFSSFKNYIFDGILIIIPPTPPSYNYFFLFDMTFFTVGSIDLIHYTHQKWYA